MDLSNFAPTQRPEKRISLRVNNEEYSTIKEYAHQNRVSVNTAFRMLISAAATTM